MVPETQHAVAPRLQEFSSLFIVFLLVKMLAAIQFNDDLLAWGAKVNNVMTNCVLASKMDFMGLMSTQKAPEFGFSFGKVVTQFGCMALHFRGGLFGWH